MASLQINNLGKSYGEHSVLKAINLSVADGEFVVLVGPSGCGKSTLLRMIAGLDDITSGELWIGQNLSNTVPPQKRNISMVFQSYALFPHMSVSKNVGFGPRIRGEAPETIAQKVKRAASILNLSDYLPRFPRQLSGGQRQRVAMGRSIVREPNLFLFDEPLSNLDAKLRVQMRTEIKALHQSLKTTIIYVTHDQIEAMTMADRIVVMNGGKIEQIGAPLELYDRPANRFVASFLGSPAMSFIPATIEMIDNKPYARISSETVLALGDRHIEPGRSVTIGIRPEKYRLADGASGLPLQVKVVEPTGAETHIFGALANTDIRCVFRERLDTAPGQTLRLFVDPSDIHLFDEKTGDRL